MAGTPLQGRTVRVGMSLSEPPADELRALGLGPDAVQALVSTMVPRLLDLGCHIVYGGDPLRELTQVLADIEQEHRCDRDRTISRLTTFVAPYLRDAASTQALREVMGVVAVERDAEPNESDTVRIIRDLTAMRSELLGATDVRVVAGGALMPGDPGTRRGPGVLEEAYLSIVHGQPLFVLGGYGGAGRLVVDALHDRLDPAEVERLRRHMVDRATLEGSTLEADFDEMLAAFHPGTDLHDGLDAERRAVLAASTDAGQVTEIVVRALGLL